MLSLYTIQYTPTHIVLVLVCNVFIFIFFMLRISEKQQTRGNGYKRTSIHASKIIRPVVKRLQSWPVQY